MAIAALVQKLALHSHPALSGSESRFRLSAIILVRASFLSFLIFALNNVIPLGTSPWALCAGVLIGTAVASILSFGRLTSSGFMIALGLVFVAYRLLLAALGLLPPGILGSVFLVPTLELHLNLVLLASGLAAISTWAFWRSPHALTAEVLALAAAAISVLAGHRNFRLDQPQQLNTLAWVFGWSPLATLTIVGVTIVLALLAFLMFTSPPGRPEAGPIGTAVARPQFVHRDSWWSLAGLFTAILLAALLYLIGQLAFWVFTKEAGSRTMMGVGQENREEMTPLGFHSSLGKNAQPSALVRLEGDYSQNPFSPMLYFRESALSEFNGHEMVLAAPRFDLDVNRSRPDEIYTADPDLELLSRTPIVQSIFLLAEHKTAFALDYPLQIRQLKNPNPSRFKAAYKVYSVAPGFSLKDLAGLGVGDSRWAPDVLKHYTAAHQDARYTELAKKITEGVSDPVAQTFLIKDWFSKNAIYTLTPGHEIPPDQDPVAPFLFGDMRGYCVHFAHAMVYLYRALGIPARIGTGYLTDLSQSRDGHILLRMNDRHAWSEVYFQGRGWIPFDPQPEHVENHGESPVDMKLLEDLMGMLGPSEEALPKEVAKDESGLEQDQGVSLPDGRYVGIPLGAFLLIVLGAKLLLWFGWRLRRAPLERLPLLYRSQLARLYDLGIKRAPGETRAEFQERLSRIYGAQLLPETSALGAITYGAKANAPLAVPARPGTLSPIVKQLSVWRRLWAVCNPASGLAFLLRRSW